MRARLVPELICTDISASLEFYCGLLGFRVLYARPDDRFAFLDREGAELMLEQPFRRDRLWPNAQLEKPYGRGVNFEVRVSNVDDLHAAIKAAGLPVYLPIEERWYRRDQRELGVRQFALQDPDGYLIRLQAQLGERLVRR